MPKFGSEPVQKCPNRRTGPKFGSGSGSVQALRYVVRFSVCQFEETFEPGSNPFEPEPSEFFFVILVELYAM
jgi:hypothetical protein